MIVIENPCFDPPHNQAFEEYVFEHAEPGQEALLIWRNDPAVVVGCYQNVYQEVDLARAAALGVSVVRRESGGGAVYHDRGNVNYTLITGPRAAGDYAALIAPVVRALNDLGVPARMNRTSDIAVAGRKVSGSAQRVKKDRVLHHGTLLYDADLTRLHELADGQRGRFASKGVKSSPWPVANIRDSLGRSAMPVEDFMEALKSRLAPGAAAVRLTEAEEAAVRALAAEKYRSWDWTCGRSPAFTREADFLLGGLPVSMRMAVKKGVVEAVAFEPGLPALEEAARRLTGARLEMGEAQARLQGLHGLEALWRELF